LKNLPTKRYVKKYKRSWKETLSAKSEVLKILIEK